MKSKQWLERQNKDFFVKNAKNKGYLARSSFKLIEIDKKFKLLKKSKHILEVGSSPGGWSQVICEKNNHATIHAFDIKNMKYFNPRIKFFKKDFFHHNFNLSSFKYDLVLSDIAPNTIGHKSTDHLRIVSMIENLLNIVENIIQLEGNLVFKIWKGLEDKNITEDIKKKFNQISIYKPQSSRKESSEIYIIAKKYIY